MRNKVISPFPLFGLIRNEAISIGSLYLRAHDLITVTIKNTFIAIGDVHGH